MPVKQDVIKKYGQLRRDGRIFTISNLPFKENDSKAGDKKEIK